MAALRKLESRRRVNEQLWLEVMMFLTTIITNLVDSQPARRRGAGLRGPAYSANACPILAIYSCIAKGTKNNE